jgi:hypothetical protein
VDFSNNTARAGFPRRIRDLDLCIRKHIVNVDGHERVDVVEARHKICRRHVPGTLELRCYRSSLGVVDEVTDRLFSRGGVGALVKPVRTTNMKLTLSKCLSFMLMNFYN